MIIREATKNDMPGVAKVQIDTWRSTYRGMVPDKVLDTFDYQVQAKKFEEIVSDDTKFLIVAEVGSEIIGFAAGGRERTGEYGFDGEVYAVYVLKAFQGRGIGRSLMEASADRLLQMGLDAMLVWVLEQNSYRKFYERIGGEYVAKKPLEMADADLFVVGYGWRSIREGLYQ